MLDCDVAVELGLIGVLVSSRHWAALPLSSNGALFELDCRLPFALEVCSVQNVQLVR